MKDEEERGENSSANHGNEGNALPKAEVFADVCEQTPLINGEQ